jgi:hypothetical protein
MQRGISRTPGHGGTFQCAENAKHIATFSPPLAKALVECAEALALLKQSGFSTAKHLGGGILSYARTVDPSIPEY